ncbi:MAG TPA: DUF423 domain-containing protein [Cytophagaceae bacterium]|jgi:uncharacterized membrane protein YgdD (TMEM256/DUF423 family)|nr:DUF423 domain-containing protein [Cytophagaceae bacterium]
MQKLFLILGAFLGALSVMIGAFGAHALKNLLTANGRTDVFETAVKYQFYHSFALLITGMLMLKFQHKFFEYAGISFISGVIIFSGSLYILCITNVKWWGAVTPIGGLCMVAGWLLMAFALMKSL